VKQLPRCNKLVKLKPDFADAYNSLGSALYQLQQFDQAIQSYKKALSLKRTLTR